jgi:hypothetical protein
MSQTFQRKSQAIFGALAAIATLGAVQIGAGAAASSPTLADRFEALGEPAGAAGINRAAKGDRDVNVPQAAEPARTVLLRVDSLADTSVLVRIPVKEVRNLAPAQPAAKPAGDKAKKMVACEPVVSVLTEVAKLLQPGKCVT